MTVSYSTQTNSQLQVIGSLSNDSGDANKSNLKI